MWVFHKCASVAHVSAAQVCECCICGCCTSVQVLHVWVLHKCVVSPEALDPAGICGLSEMGARIWSQVLCKAYITFIYSTHTRT